MTKIAACLLVFACLGAAPAARAQRQPAAAPADARAAELHAKLQRQLDEIAAGFDGVMGVAVKDLATGETFGAHNDVVFPQASSIKIAILVELFRQAQAGAVRLDDRVEVKHGQMVGGSGVLQHFGDSASAVSLRDLAVLMIVLSDNTATNILIDRVGLASVNENLRRLGLQETRLARRMIDIEAQRAGRENVSTPREMAALLEMLQQGKALDAQHTAAALEILKYPKEGPLRRGLPERVALADKSGTLAGVRCDSGIVLLPGRPYVISVMTTYGESQEAAERAIGEVSRRVFDYFDRLAHANAYGVRLP